MHTEIIRSVLPQTLLAPAPAGAGEHGWPVDPWSLLALYRAEPIHARALRVKAEGACGRGLGGEAAARLAALMPGGDADFMVRLALDLDCYGNAFVERVRDRAGRLARLELRPAPTVRRRAGGGYVQRVWDGAREHVTSFSAEEMLHLRVPCPGAGFYSLPPWLGAAGMIELVDAATRYNQRFFDGNAVPEHVIVHTGGGLDDAQKRGIRDFFRTEMAGLDSARKTLFLSLPEGQKIEFQAVARERDGDFLKLMEAARERIPSAHGVPPRMLGIMSAGQLGGGSEVTQQLFVFEVLTLAPMRRWLLDGLRPVLAELGVDRAQVELAGLDLTPPGDAGAHAAEWLAAGLIERDEARAMLDLPARTTKSAAAGDGTAALMATLLGRL